MTLIQAVVAEIRAKGQASVDDVCLPGTTRNQISKAFQNAAYRRQIKAIKHRQRGRWGGRACSVYAVWDDPRPAAPWKGRKPREPRKPVAIRQEPAIAPVSSVFDMGTRVEQGLPCWVQRRPRADFERAEA